MRTPALHYFHENISDWNRHYSYILFVSEQFQLDNKEILENEKQIKDIDEFKIYFCVTSVINDTFYHQAIFIYQLIDIESTTKIYSQ